MVQRSSDLPCGLLSTPLLQVTTRSEQARPGAAASSEHVASRTIVTGSRVSHVQEVMRRALVPRFCGSLAAPSTTVTVGSLS